MQCHYFGRYTEIAQRIFKYSDIQYTTLSPDKTEQFDIYIMLFCVNMYGSYKRLKNSPFFAHPVQNFIQLLSTLTKLCRIMHDHPVNVYISQHIYHEFGVLLIDDKQGL